MGGDFSGYVAVVRIYLKIAGGQFQLLSCLQGKLLQ